jgi:hypothetical protein
MRKVFPIKEFREIFPNAELDDVKHYTDMGDFERKNILWIYGEVKPSQYPRESKIFFQKLKEYYNE